MEWRKSLIIFLVFWLIFFLFMTLEGPVSNILIGEQLSSWELRKFEPLRLKSEYKISEQLSKYYLFLVIIIAIVAYGTILEPSRIKLSISFLLAGLTMYLSESNIIANKVQPLLGFIVIGVTFYLLCRQQLWLPLSLLLLACLIIFCGVLADMSHEIETVKEWLSPQTVAILDNFGEETFDAAGIGFICLASIFCFFDRLENFIIELPSSNQNSLTGVGKEKLNKGNICGAIFLLLCLGMMAVGNGFLHARYEPVIKLEIVAFFLTVSGFIGLLLTNKYFVSKDKRLTLVNEDLFYGFVFSFFVVLPTVFGDHNLTLESLVLWLPLLTSLGFYLYYRKFHPL